MASERDRELAREYSMRRQWQEYGDRAGPCEEEALVSLLARVRAEGLAAGRAEALAAVRVRARAIDNGTLTGRTVADIVYEAVDEAERALAEGKA